MQSSRSFVAVAASALAMTLAVPAAAGWAGGAYGAGSYGAGSSGAGSPVLRLPFALVPLAQDPSAPKPSTAPPPSSAPPAETTGPTSPTEPEVTQTAAETTAPETEEAPHEPTPSLVERLSVGLRISVAPGVYIPSTGNAGFLFEVRVRYGIKTGPLVLLPGADGTFIFPSNTAVIAGMPTFGVLVPIGIIGPFVYGGAGGGAITATGQGGVALKAGGGLVVIPSEHFGLGLEVTRFGIVDTGFETTTIAPFLFVGF